MVIALLIVVMAVGASGLYMAVTFNTRTRRNLLPLLDDAVKDIVSKIESESGEARRQLWVIAEELQEASGRVRRLEAAGDELRERMRAITEDSQEARGLAGHLEAAREEAREQARAIADGLREASERVRNLEATRREAQEQMGAIAEDLQQNGELVKQLHGQGDTWRSQLGGDLAQLGHRVTELRESLARQGAQIAIIHSYVMRREMPARGSAKGESLILALLEAESHVDGKGWGGPPLLYALTERASDVVVDHAGPDALVPVEKEWQPDGDLIEALAGIQWPADVVGCVLFAELAALPPGSEEGPLLDADAAGQWTSARPDGRPARLAIGVCRSGEHECGLRIKGEDEIRFQAELADGLVTALLDTFQSGP